MVADVVAVEDGAAEVLVAVVLEDLAVEVSAAAGPVEAGDAV